MMMSVSTFFIRTDRRGLRPWWTGSISRSPGFRRRGSAGLPGLRLVLLAALAGIEQRGGNGGRADGGTGSDQLLLVVVGHDSPMGLACGGGKMQLTGICAIRAIVARTSVSRR
jgi:hypothetical protein